MSRRDSIRSKANVMYMEDVDDNSGDVIEGTETYAASVASPTKEKMNTSRKKSRRGDSSSPGNLYTDSDSTAHPTTIRRDSKIKSKDKEKAPSTKKVTLAPRPTTKHSRTAPVVQPAQSHRKSRDESSYYGVDPATVTSASSRPRAHTSSQRPASYYGSSSKPPLSNSRYHMHPSPGALPTSYPPQPWMAAGPVSYPLPPPPVTSSQPDYFQPRPPHHQLLARFERPASAMGYRAPAAIGYSDNYDSGMERGGLIRRPSLSRKPRVEDDKLRMPPPPLPPTRPMSARPLTIRTSPFAPPPAPRRSAAFDDESFDGEASMYQDVSPLTQYDYANRRLSRTRRPSVGATSVVYDTGTYATEVAASGRNSRRNSYYGNQSASSGSGFEDKLRQASTYQDEVSGGASLPLTAEALRKASRHGGASSRSTRSSGSHDESDWRQSNTTRTTQSNDEDITIKVKGNAYVKVGAAEMDCQDGAEINISSRGPGGIRSASDKSSYADPDERMTRLNRPTLRNRTNSQAPSYSRAPSRYDYPYTYEYSSSPFTPAPAPGGYF